jgi:hypothetical protein
MPKATTDTVAARVNVGDVIKDAYGTERIVIAIPSQYEPNGVDAANSNGLTSLRFGEFTRVGPSTLACSPERVAAISEALRLLDGVLAASTPTMSNLRSLLTEADGDGSL